jgi:hypothetical protein
LRRVLRRTQAVTFAKHSTSWVSSTVDDLESVPRADIAEGYPKAATAF